MMPLRKSARSHSHVFPSDKSNMIEDYNGDDETVLSEEEDASAMDVDKKGITAEGKDGAIFIAKTFNRHSNGEKEYNPPQKFHIGKATPLPKDKKTGEQWYQIQYEDNDTETMNEFEFCQHKVTKRRADELRPTEDSPKELITPVRLELRKSDLAPGGVDRLMVTEVGPFSAGTIGRIEAHKGKNKGSVYSVVFSDGRCRNMKKKNLAVIGVANPSWDLLSIVHNANLMPSESQHVRLVLTENGVDYLLSRHHSDRWVLAPQPPLSGRVHELSTSALHDRIKSGSLRWCHPEKAVFTGVTRVSGGDCNDEGELEDHFDSSDSDPEDDEGDVSDDGSLEEIEAPAGNSGRRSIYSLSKFIPIAAGARNTISRIIQNLPSIRSGRAAKNSRIRHDGQGWLRLQVQDALAEGFTGKDLAEHYRSPGGVVVLDPLSMYEGYTPELKELRCPNCGECGRVTSKGFAKGSARCYGYDSAMPVICRRFRCRGCPKSKGEKKETTFTAADIVGEFDPALREHLPVAVGRYFVTRGLLSMLISLALKGMSISKIASIVEEMYHERYLREHAGYLRHCNALRKKGSVSSTFGGPWKKARVGPAAPPEEFGGEDGRFCGSATPPSKDTIKRAIVGELKRWMPMQLRYITSLTGRILKSDHTFWATKHARERHKQLYSALYGIMNEHAEVLFWAFTTSKATNELAGALEQFKERFGESPPSVWYVDNPKEVAKFLRYGTTSNIFSGFGEHLLVLADLFHMIYNVGLVIQEHPMKEQFLTDLSNALTTVDELDQKSEKEWKRELVSKGICSASEVDKQKCPRQKRRYMHTVGDDSGKQEAVEKIDKVLEMYSGKRHEKTGNPMISPNAYLAISRIKEYIREDMLGDPGGETVYYCYDKDAPYKRYYTVRGSSQLESFWRILEDLFNGPNTSVEWIDLIMTTAIFRYNIDKKIRRKGFEKFPTYNMNLINEINTLCHKLGQEPAYPTWKHPPDSSPMQLMGCQLLRRGQSSYETFKSVIGENGGVGSGVLREFEKAGSDHWLSSGTGMPTHAGPVSTPEERLLYRAMEPSFRSAGGLSKWDSVDFEGLAESWNKLVFNAFARDHDVVIYEDKSYSRDAIYLKDVDHFKYEAKESFKAMSCARQQGCSKESRKAFREKRRSLSNSTTGAKNAGSSPMSTFNPAAHYVEMASSVVSMKPSSVPEKVKSWVTTQTGNVATTTGSGSGPEIRTHDGKCSFCGNPGKHKVGCRVRIAEDTLLHGLSPAAKKKKRQRSGWKETVVREVAKAMDVDGVCDVGGDEEEAAGGTFAAASALTALAATALLEASKNKSGSSSSNDGDSDEWEVGGLGSGSCDGNDEASEWAIAERAADEADKKDAAEWAAAEQVAHKADENEAFWRAIYESSRMQCDGGSAELADNTQFEEEDDDPFSPSRVLNERYRDAAGVVENGIGGKVVNVAGDGTCLVYALMPEETYIDNQLREDVAKSTRCQIKELGERKIKEALAAWDTTSARDEAMTDLIGLVMSINDSLVDRGFRERHNIKRRKTFESDKKTDVKLALMIWSKEVVTKGYYLSNWELRLLSHLDSSLACVATMNNSRTAVQVLGFKSAAHMEVPIAAWPSSLLLRERIPLFNRIDHYLRIDMGCVFDRARSQLPAKELKAVNNRWKLAASKNSGDTARTYEAFRGSVSVDVPMSVVQRERSGWYKDETLEHYCLLLNERDVRLRLLLPARFRKAVIYCGPSTYNSSISRTIQDPFGGAVRSIMNRVRKYTECSSVFELGAVYFTLNVGGNHWMHAKIDFEQLEISFRDLYHSNRLEGLKPHFYGLLSKLYEQDQPLLEAEKGVWLARKALRNSLGSAIAPTAAMDSDLPAEREQGSHFMKIAKFALRAFASIGSSDCSLEPLSLPLSFASKGKAAVLSPATDGRFAKLCLFQQDEADLIPGATYDVDVAALSTKAREAVAALRGGSSAAQVDKGDGAITFVLDIFDSKGERLQRTAGIAVIPGSGIIIIDHIGVFTKGVGHGRVVWMAMILVGAQILKAIFKTEAVASIVKEPTGDGPGFYRYMGYSTHRADGNNNLRLPVNVLSGGDSCAAIGDEPERPKFSDWSYVGLPPKHYPDQTGDSTSCGPMTLMALNYEGDGLQPNFSKENCQEGGVFRPRITHDLDRGRVDSVWEHRKAQRTGR